MDEYRNDSDAGAANASEPGAASAANHQHGDANINSGDAVAANSVAPNEVGVATGQDVSAAISHKVTYSVTIDEAQERFARARRKVPSIRSMQRYCEEGLFLALRTQVTYGDGSHAKPWFINDESLDAYIKKQPVVVLGDADDATPKTATPNREVGGATTPQNEIHGGAGGANQEPQNREVAAPAPPAPPAKDEPPSIPLSEVLLENARLQERLEGRNEVIKRLEEGQDRERKEWHSEREFLRTDVTETRNLVKAVQAVSDRILDTFRQIGSKSSDSNVQPDQILYRPANQNGQGGGESNA